MPTDAEIKAGPPAGFRKLESGIKCRCIRTWTDGRDYWCGDLTDGCKVTELVVNKKTDVELAKEFRERLSATLETACAILNEAQAAGLVLGFNISPAPPLGKYVVGPISVAKHF